MKFKPSFGRPFDVFVMWLKQRLCHHRFALEDLEKTGIPAPKEPEKLASFEEWSEYWREYYDGDWNTKRIKWPCDKCGKTFYAHCGLDVPHASGVIFRRGN